MAELKRYRWSGHAIDVPFLFGALGADAVIGPVLVRMLAELDVRESAARNLLVRMRQMGFVDVERRGRVAVYRINQESAHRYHQVEGTADPPVWEGRFHAILYDIPEGYRRLRDRLHHTAQSVGYAQLRPGVLITVGDRWSRLRLGAADFPSGTWCQRLWLEPASLAEARAMAERAFDLGRLAGLYRAALASCDRVPEQVEACWASLRLWRELYSSFFAAQIGDPYLPAALLPDDWPAARFRAAQLGVNERVGNVVQPFLRGHAGAADSDHLCEYYRSPWAHADPTSAAGARMDARQPSPGTHEGELRR